MQFQFEGKTYQIDFRRDHQRVHVADPIVPKVKHVVSSTFPYTTVLISEVVPTDTITEQNQHVVLRPSLKLFRTATVGCWHRERSRYSPERGRIHALRLVMKTLPKPFYTAMWDAYVHRPKARHARKLTQVVEAQGPAVAAVAAS